MYKLSLSDHNFTIKKEQGKTYILDSIRKKYVRLTPEEWVRQHTVRYLIDHKKFPQSLMKIEVGLDVYSLLKRADILCYTSKGEPLVLVECKAPEVAINQAVFEQIAQYNIVLQAPYLLVTNGVKMYSCTINFATKKFEFLHEFPTYTEMITLLNI